MYKVAIFGKARTGKNTLSRMLVKQVRVQQGHYVTAKYVAFADPIKEMAQIMFPQVPKRWLFGPSQLRDEVILGAFKDGQPLTVRQLLIDIGTALGRGYNSRIWLDNFDHRLKRVFQQMIVVPDVRFMDEIEHLRKRGYYLIRLYRALGQSNIKHVSETGQDAINDSEFDYILHNDHKPSDLRQEVINQIIPRLKDKK